MVNVVIAGVPKNIKISQFIEFLESNIFQEKIKVRVNYIRWYKRDLKKLSLNMRSNDARKAIRYLNGYEYVSRRSNYTFSCWKENSADGSESEGSIEPPSKMARRLSPDEPDELQVIDHKIELIRKQRILLEEESQLLLQKKRLEMIQNLGPNDFRKLSQLEEMVELNQSNTETKVEEKSRRPPDFHGPWQIIHEKMKSVIKAYVDDQVRPIFIDLLRTRVKNRLALILKDEGQLRAKEILALYRNIHPAESDISLVQEVLVKINQSIYPINMTTKIKNGEENEQDDTAGYADIKHNYEDIEKIGVKDSQNEEMAFYEDVNPDFDNNTNQETIVKKPETIEKELGLDENQTTEKERNYEDIHIFDCDPNITSAENRETEVHKPEEINKNEHKESESDEILEETQLTINTEVCIVESEVDSLNTNIQIEPALNESLDLDNDLDDWVEDENDQQDIHADK